MEAPELDDDDSLFRVQRSRGKRRAVILDDDEDERENVHFENESAVVNESTCNPDRTNDNDYTTAIMSPNKFVSSQSPRDDSGCVTSATATNGEELSQSGLVDRGTKDVLDSDLFDAEISDDDQTRDKKTPSDDDDTSDEDHTMADGNEENSGEEDANDEGFDQSEVNPSLLAKLKNMKGASKTKKRTKYSRKAKPNADQMMEIYSESQRLLRDSRVKLPYYEPEPKLLDDFLARVNKKRQEYANLKHAKDIQKAQIICDKLAVPPPVLPEPLKKSASKSTPSLSTDKVCVRSSQCQLDGEDSLDVSPPTLESSHGKVSEFDVSPPTLESSQDASDNMTVELKASYDSTAKAACDSTLKEAEAAFDGFAEDVSGTETVSLEDIEVCVPSLQKDPSRDLFKSQSTFDGKEQILLECSQDKELQTHTTDAESDAVTFNIVGATCDISPTNSPSVITPHAARSTDIPSTCPPPENTSLATVSQVAYSMGAISTTPKPNLLDRFQGLNIPTAPKLSGTPEDIICLDDAQVSPIAAKPGLIKLMSRLVQHTNKLVTTPVNKDKSGDSFPAGDQLTVTSSEKVEEEAGLSSGSKLDQLKQHLGVSMRKKRAEARQRRLQLFALENEEGFEREEEEESSAGEEEVSGNSGSDSENMEESDQYKEYMDDSGSDDEDFNPLLDLEARDEEDEDQETGDDEDEEDKDSTSEVHLHFDLSEDEQDLDETDRGTAGHEEEGPSQPRKKGKSAILDSDVDEGTQTDVQGNVQCEYRSKMKEKCVADSPIKSLTEMTPLFTHLLDSQKQPRCEVDNSCSPDLYSAGLVVDSVSSCGRPSLQHTDSQDMAQSQMLDAEGFLKLAQTQPRNRTSLLFQEPGDHQSGSHLSLSPGQIFHKLASQTTNSGHSHQDTEEDDMKQLVALCSGKFGPAPGSPEAASTQSFRVQSQVFDQDEDSFHILSDAEDFADRNVNEDEEDNFTPSSNVNEDKIAFSDSEDEQSGSDQEADTNTKYTGLKKTRRKNMGREFLEDEAELSGSEFDSDENLDLAEEEDVLDEEEGDLDLQGISEEKLRHEVGRIHMKQLQDDDDREVMRYKELYLQDGDLYSDGGGRMRNFRWKDIEYNSQQDIFEHKSDDDEEVSDDGQDILWRKDRFEREQFLQQEDGGPTAEDSQVLKMGQFYIKRQESVPAIKDNAPITAKVQPTVSQPDKFQIQKKGSFLSRGRDTLVKMAQQVKSGPAVLAGKSSKHCVFTTIEGPDADDQKYETERAAPGKRKASSTEQTSKRAKLAPSAPTRLSGGHSQSQPQTGHHNSIFEFLSEK